MIVHQTHNSVGNYSYNAFFYDDCHWFYHFHKNFELIYVLEGEVELTLGSRQLLLQAESFALLLPNEFHAYRTPRSSRVWIAVFSADFVEQFARQTEGKRTDDPRFTCDPVTRQYLLQELIGEKTPGLLLMKSLLYAACARFLEQTALRDAGQEQDFVSNTIGFVSEHFRQELSFRDLAETFGYEYHYFSRQFHRHFGMNFKQFLNTYRLEHARDRLLYSDQGVTEIAYDSGFQTVRTFNRVFQEHTGMTPSQFRKTAPRPRRQRQNSDGTFYYTDNP